LTKEGVLRKLGSFPQPTEKILVENQDVSDIMSGVVVKHKECAKHYDVIFPMFDADGSWEEVAQRIFRFCKQEIAYKVESTDWQYVSTPMTILKKGYCDCKGYALFCAGLIDAMKRAGEEVDWCFRFASYELFNSVPGHVFVVINPKTDNIWMDPVLNNCNTHFPRPIWKVDTYVNTSRPSHMAGIGYVPGGGELIGTKINASIGLSSAEQSLLDSIDQYTEGTANGIQYAKGSGTLNTICTLVLASASAAIPIIAAAWAIIKLASTVISNEFGAGSVAGRLLNDLASNPLTFLYTGAKDLISGRTYQTDQYKAAGLHQFYVLGNASVTTQAKVTDDMVAPALKWFIDRLGVFISGDQHLEALMVSPGEYLAQASVNSYTTTDQNRVNAAYNVASQYFIKNMVAGSWANTIGVYDALICEIAQQQNETVESAAMQAGYTGVYSSEATSGPAPVDNASSFPLIPALLLGGAALLFIVPSKKTSHGN
jgi:hypothetical protein